jgi:cell division protease FtsH
MLNNRNNQDNKDNNQQQEPQNPQPDWRRWLWPGLLLFFLVWTLLTSGNLLGGAAGSSTEIDTADFYTQLEQGNVADAMVEGQSVRGRFNQSVTVNANGRSVEVQRFTTTVVSPGFAEQQLLDAGIDFDASVQQTSPLLLILINVAPFLLIILFFLWMSRRAQGQMGNVFGFGRSQAREYSAEMPRVSFEDVAGQEAAKRELVEVVDFLSNPEKYISLGARVPRGVLLVGPPGTGKTLMARAVAGEANVAFFSIAASEFVEMFVGVGASRVRDLFKRAKDNSPAIVFVDEIDAVGRQRGAGLGGGNDEREQTLNQMLSEMDGFDQSATVIVMAATNRPDVLDPALLRPGRFDRQVTVDLPDREGRKDILKIHTRGKPLGDDISLEDMAGATIGFSGADLANLANEAALNAARYDRKRILQTDFTTAFERIILGTERPPLSNPEERRVVAYHEAGHAIAAMMTPGADNVLKVTITPRGQALGITAFMPTDDRRNYPRGYLEATMNVALGGRIAEEIVFGEVTTGASNDLRRVTDIARRMVSQFGMSEAIGPLNFGENDQQPFLGYSLTQNRNYSEQTAAQIDAEVRSIVEAAHKRTTSIMNQNREGLEKVAQALLEREVVERSEILQILDMEEKPIDAPDEAMPHEEDIKAAADPNQPTPDLSKRDTGGTVGSNGHSNEREEQDEAETSDEQTQ